MTLEATNPDYAADCLDLHGLTWTYTFSFQSCGQGHRLHGLIFFVLRNKMYIFTLGFVTLTLDL